MQIVKKCKGSGIFTLPVSQKLSLRQFLECWKESQDSWRRDEGRFIRTVEVAFLSWFSEPPYPQTDQNGMKKVRISCCNHGLHYRGPLCVRKGNLFSAVNSRQVTVYWIVVITVFQGCVGRLVLYYRVRYYVCHPRLLVIHSTNFLEKVSQN